jgi:tetratricopeptide (TPR) repeat protein
LTPEALIGGAVSLSNQSYPDIDNAIQRFRNGDVQGARLFLEKAKEKYPNLPPAEVTLAKMQSLVRNHQAVHVLLESAVVKHPDDPEAYMILAEQAFAGGRTTEANALFENTNALIQKFDQNAKRKRNFTIRLLAGQAAVAERRQQWEEAVGLLKQWTELDPENATACQRYGVVLFRLKKAAEAFEQFTKAREINPNAPHPYVLVGKLSAQEGAEDKAREAFERAYSEDKINVKTAQAYVEWLIQEDQLDQAQQVTSELLKGDPDSVSSLILSSIIAQMNGKSDQAEKSLQKVLALDPGNASATNLLAQLLIERDDQPARERALSYAQANARQFPKNGQSNITLAWVLYKLGNLQQAQTALNTGIRAGGLSMDSTYLVARFLAEQDKKEHAIQALTQVINKSGLFIHRKQAEELLAKLQAEK